MTTKRERRASRRRASAIANVMAMGALLVLVPLFLGKSPIGKAIAPMNTLGWLLLVGGGIALWLNSKPDKEGAARPLDTTGNQGPARQPAKSSVTTPSPAAAVAPINNHRTARPTAWGPEVFSVIEWRRFEAVVEADRKSVV